MITVNEIKLTLDEAVNKDLELLSLKRKVYKKTGIRIEDIKKIEIIKKAVDARNRDDILFVYNLDLEVEKEGFYLQKSQKISKTNRKQYQDVFEGTLPLKHPIVVVGFGPSGLFASYLLAKRGYPVLVIEQGEDVISRTKHVEVFLRTGKFQTKASILYGEGGAGTFSDGKLTTLVNDIRSKFILETFIKNGANEEIGYINKPHIGTDVLKKVVSNMRQEILSFGGEIRFNTKLTNIEMKDQQLSRIEVNHNEWIDSNLCLLGIGHSAKDTVEMLLHKGIVIEPKPFSIGVRIEHKQSLINQSQYGYFASHKALGAADYKLFYHHPSGRTAYTFCMCPGGEVMPSNGEEGHVVTNGMSKSLRNLENANSALLVSVTPEDFGSKDPLAGFQFQSQFEELAFKLGGKNYFAPVQKVGDFLQNKLSTSFGSVLPSYKPGTTFVKMTDLLPPYVTDTLKDALLQFDKQIKGFATQDALLTGVETRSSSPVRLVRDTNYETNISGLFPMGEGAGYAGGIMSSAIDGMKIAEHIIETYKR